MFTFAECLRHFRIKAKLNQKELAEKVGVSYSAYNKYETQGSEPKIDTLIKLASVLNCSIDELLGSASFLIKTKVREYWFWSISNTKVFQNGPFDSREEAIEDAKEALKRYGIATQSIFVVACESYKMPDYDVDKLIEDMKNTVYDDCGEVAESWLDDVTDKEKAVLAESINGVFREWIKKNGLEPDFYLDVRAAEQVKI